MDQSFPTTVLQPSRNLISIGQASEYLGVSIDTLRRWEKKGRIEAFRSPGGHRYYDKTELDQLFGKRYTRDEPTKGSVHEIPREESPSMTPPQHIPFPPLPAREIQIPTSPPPEIAPAAPRIRPMVVETIQEPIPQPQEIPVQSFPENPQVLVPSLPQSPANMNMPSSTSSSLWSSQKEKITVIIVIGVLVIVIILAVILVVMLWQSSRNVLSPSP